MKCPVPSTLPDLADEDVTRPGIVALVITYRRPEVLESTVGAFLCQTRPPDSMIVIDNDADDSVRSLTDQWAGVSYLAMPENLGPAGAVAAGMQMVIAESGPDDWILLIDDDDPPPFATAVEEVFAAALRAPPDVAAVGLTGERYDRWTGLGRRIPDEQLSDWSDVDLIGNNQVPLYRVQALSQVGTFDPGIFIFFEELEFGLRLRRHGRRLVITREITMKTRAISGRTGLGRHAPSVRRSGSWRSYYSARNEILVARRYATWVAPLIVTGRIIVGGAARALRGRSGKELGPRLRGLYDGWRGRTGRTVDP